MTENIQGKLKVYRSSAGSGKTYTLAKEYIKLLLTHREVEKVNQSENYFRHILAITFTNDAANEMKERVLQYLKEFSDLKEGDEHSLLKQVHSEIAIEYPNEKITPQIIIQRSAIILQSILHRFSDFNIQTIDSFTNQIARSFTRELGLPGNYEIYLDTATKLSESVDILLAHVDNKEKSLLKWLFEFVKGRIDEDKNWNIAYNLKEFSSTLTDEKVYELLESLKDWDLEQFDAVRTQLSKEYAIITSTCIKMAQEGLNYIKSQGLDYDDFKYKSNGAKSLFVKNIESPFSKDLGVQLAKCLENNEWLGPNAVPKGDSVDNVNTQISLLASNLDAFQNAKRGRFLVIKNILSNYYELALLNKVKAILEELKEKDDQAFLTDLNEKIRNVVLNEPVPFIYEKAGVRYKHLLIDEFQDTSVFQWINLIPLISNALSEGNVNLIVGDVKQSIYRWRGADPDILVNLPESKEELRFLPIQEHMMDWKKMVEIKALDSNWRSKPGIVKFNNEFFEWLKDNNEEYPRLGQYYDDVIQNAEGKGESDIKIDILTEKDFTNKDEMQDAKAGLVIDYINKCLDKGYEWRDMAILCRSNNDNRRISEALVEGQVSIISDESLLLESSSPIKILIHVFNFLNEPGNQDKCAQLFISIANYIDHPIRDWESIKAHLRVKSASDFIHFIIDRFDLETTENQLLEGTVYQLGQAWINALNLMKDLRQQVYLDYFLDVLFDHSSKSDSGMSQFLEYWEEKKEKLSISSSRDQNAVRILTIHRSKGLEYPVVIIPYPEWSYSINGNEKIWAKMPDDEPSDLPVAVLSMSKDLEETNFSENYTREKNAKFIEEVNALYVAMTRAEDRLYIIASIPTKKNMSNFIIDFLSFEGTEAQTYVADSFNYSSYSFEQQEKGKEGGIENSVLPWNNAQIQRTRIDRNLRWSVDFTLSKEALERIEAGKSFHLLMSFFKTEEDIQKIFQMASDVYVEENDLILFKKFIQNLLSDLEIKSYFEKSWKIHTEKAILYDGEIYRPDRFQIKENKIVIIDYKTGLKDDKHKAQIAHYESGLRDVYPDHKIIKYLIYSEPFGIINVP